MDWAAAAPQSVWWVTETLKWESPPLWSSNSANKAEPSQFPRMLWSAPSAFTSLSGTDLRRLPPFSFRTRRESSAWNWYCPSPLPDRPCSSVWKCPNRRGEWSSRVWSFGWTSTISSAAITRCWSNCSGLLGWDYSPAFTRFLFYSPAELFSIYPRLSAPDFTHWTFALRRPKSLSGRTL